MHYNTSTYNVGNHNHYNNSTSKLVIYNELSKKKVFLFSPTFIQKK